MAKQQSPWFDAAGWGFWGIVFGMLVGPCVFLAWKIKRTQTAWVLPIGVGLLLAALGAGFVSWAVNGVVQYRRKKQRLVERKRAKKRK